MTADTGKSSGDAILFPPGSFRERLYSDQPGYYASFNVLFPENTEFPFNGHIPGCVQASTIELLRIFKQDYTSASFCRDEKCKTILSYLLYQLEDIFLDKENPHIKSIKQYILNNISCHITLNDISKIVHLTPEYCSSLFKKNVGENIFTYILKHRTELAASLLLTTDMPLIEIAERCGFESYTYFSHTFKRIMGISARDYRQIKR